MMFQNFVRNMVRKQPFQDAIRNSSQHNKDDKNSNDESVDSPPPKKVKSEQISLSSPPMPKNWTYISLSNDGMSFKEGFTDKMEGLPEDAGKWLIFIDGEFSVSSGSLRDYCWKIAKRLVGDFKNTGIISAKCSTKWSSRNTKGAICCYTANHNDKLTVKKAAEAIRKAYPHVSDLYYKTEAETQLGNYRKNGTMAVTKYKYSRNKFYERGTQLTWQLVDETNQASSINHPNQSSINHTNPSSTNLTNPSSINHTNPSSIIADEEFSYEDTDYDSDDEDTESKWTYISSSNDGTSFNEGVTDEMEGLPDNAGKWIMFNDGDFCAFSGMSHQSYAWEIVKKLVMDFKNTGIISAKCTTTWESENSIFNKSPKGVICCYTADYNDKQCVKRAVEAIRKAYPYALDMYYETEEDSYHEDYRYYRNETIAKYKYTIGKKFYEMGEDYVWHLVDECSQVTSTNLASLSSSIIMSETGADSKLHLVDKVDQTTTLPSTISTHEWLYISSLSGNQETLVQTSEDIRDLPPDSGKWLLFHNKNSICPSVNMSHHDYAWQVLKYLVIDSKNTGVIAAKSSTGKKSYKYSDSQGVICCYTENFNDIIDVKKAADAIRNVYSYSSPMYYKTEESTVSGIYSKSRRSNRVSIYQHFENNTMYERDCDSPWQLITFY